MNPQMQTQEQLATTAKSEMAPNERDLLAQWGVTAEQIS